MLVYYTLGASGDEVEYMGSAVFVVLEPRLVATFAPR